MSSPTIVRQEALSPRQAYMRAARERDARISALAAPFGTDDPRFEELAAHLTDIGNPTGRGALEASSDETRGLLYRKYMASDEPMAWPAEVPEWNVADALIEGGHPETWFHSEERRAELGRFRANVAVYATIDLEADTVNYQPEIATVGGIDDNNMAFRSAAEARAAALVLLQAADDFDRITGNAIPAAEPGE